MTAAPSIVSFSTARSASFARSSGNDVETGLRSISAAERKKVAGIGTRHVRDAANLAFAPQQRVVVEARNAVEVDRVDPDDAALAQRSQRVYDDRATGQT